MIYAHLVLIQTPPSKIHGGEQRPSIEIKAFFVSDDLEAEKYYSKIYAEASENFDYSNVNHTLLHNERFLCSQGFIPAGKTSDERTYYLPNKK